MYGCHDLRRNDRDADVAANVTQIWGGTANAAASICPGGSIPAAPLPPTGASTVAIPQHVHQLQEDLRTLGFLFLSTVNGNFGLQTDRALREFQIYAKMTNVARIKAGAPATSRQAAHIVAQLGQDPAVAGAQPLSVYVDSLEQTANTLVYTGPVSGVANAATRDCIQHWLDHEFRCPVIVEAWNVNRSNQRTTLHQIGSVFGVNVWRHDEWNNSGPRFFVRDFTGYYALPATVTTTDMMVIGDFQPLPANRTFNGPRSEPPRFCLPDAEITRDKLMGAAPYNASQESTFRVVRSFAEVECIGFFDCVNCFDNAFVSVGPCHWTLGISGTGAGTNRAVSRGELPGYLSYLRNVDNAAFRGLFEFFGASVAEDWVNSGGVDTGLAAGADLFSATSRKYSGRMQLQEEAGTFATLSLREQEWNYFKSWHWHYRFVMAGRTTDVRFTGYQRRMWDMARMRIRDIGNLAWGAGVTPVTVSPGVTRPATISDVITSEKAMAMVVRWHIRAPAHMANGGAGTRLVNILNRATNAQPALNWTTDPSTWTDAHEAALIEAILAEANNNPPGGLPTTLAAIDTWPSWVPPGRNPRRFQLANPGTLAVTRNSFSFNTTGLPPEPRI
jgi:hypothetical protein